MFIIKPKCLISMLHWISYIWFKPSLKEIIPVTSISQVQVKFCICLYLLIPVQGPWEAQRAVPKETRFPLTDCQYVAGLKGNTEDNAWHASVHPLLCLWAHKEAGLGAHELIPLNPDRMMIFQASSNARTLCLCAVQLSASLKRITERSRYVSLMFYTASQLFWGL